jgi:hypothetical protein
MQSVQDVAGDLLFLLESSKFTYKEWVADLSVPYITFFVVAAGASIATVIGKLVLVVQKSRSRGRARARAVAPAIAPVGGVREDRLAKLDEEIEANRLDQRKLYVVANADCVSPAL